MTSPESSPWQKRSLMRTPWSRALFYLTLYVAWIGVFRVLALSVITYFLLGSHPRFQEINDILTSNNLLLSAICATLFLTASCWLHPISSTERAEIITWRRIQMRYLPGVAAGFSIGLCLVAAFVLSGSYRYYGFFIQPEEASVSISSIISRILAIGALVYSEEFIFRQRILTELRKEVPDLIAALVTAILYAFVKTVQFDLGILHSVTLLLAALVFGLHAIAEADFAWSAGAWSAALTLFHPLCSLSIFGIEYSGVFLVKYGPAGAADTALNRFLTGGIGGPLSSFAFQLILMLEVARILAREKKLLLKAG